MDTVLIIIDLLLTTAGTSSVPPVKCNTSGQNYNRPVSVFQEAAAATKLYVVASARCLAFDQLVQWQCVWSGLTRFKNEFES